MTDFPNKAAPRISFVSLGCPKALVDSERIITRLRAEGYELSRSHAGADAGDNDDFVLEQHGISPLLRATRS